MECWFCGGPGPFGKEHLFAEKWRKIWPDQSNVHIFTENFAEPIAERQKPRREWADKPFVVKTGGKGGRVCRKCNNGWMSRLEADAHDAVFALASGDLDVCDHDTLNTLGRWIAKTSYVAEIISDTVAASATVEQRRALVCGATPEFFHWWVVPLTPNNGSGFWISGYYFGSSENLSDYSATAANMQLTSLHLRGLSVIAINSQDEVVDAIATEIIALHRLLGQCLGELPRSASIDFRHWPVYPALSFDSRHHDTKAYIARQTEDLRRKIEAKRDQHREPDRT